MGYYKRLRNISWPSRTLMMAYFLFAASLGIVVSIIIYTNHIDVIKDWKLTLPTKDIHVGDQIVIESSYVKLREVKGKARRYINCQNQRGVYVKYELNQRDADNKPGKGATGIDIVVRRDIPNLPTRCKFRVSIDYPVLPFKTVTEVGETEEFILQGERTSATESEQSSASSSQQTTPSQGSASQAGKLNEFSSSYSNNTPNTNNEQSNNSQPPQQQPSPVEAPSLLNRLTQPIEDLVGRIL